MRLQVLVFALIVSAVVAMAGVVNAAEGQAAPSSQVKFVSGGVGEESLEHMQAIRKDFNLKLLFALKAGNSSSKETKPSNPKGYSRGWRGVPDGKSERIESRRAGADPDTRWRRTARFPSA